MSFSKIITNLVNSNNYFTEKNINISDVQHRIIGINECSLRVDDGLNPNRINYWYWSTEFELLMSEKNIENQSIYELFTKNKENLKDLLY